MKRITIIFAIVMLMISTSVFAQRTTDIEGSKDYPLVSRFQGSIIEWYQQLNFGRYYALSLKDHKLSPYEIDGRITRIQYSAGKEHSVFEIYKSYENALKNAGFNILVSLDEMNSPSNLNEKLYFDEFGGVNKLPRESIKPDHAGKWAYIAAKNHNNKTDTYVVVFVTNSGWPLITFDAIEVKSMDTGLVTAKNMGESISTSGHIAIYDIHFDTGKSEIKPGSTVALKNIAEYLNSHTSQRFLIVGHSDNVGNFDANIRLSKERAKAVMNELITKYNVKPEQLKACGDGSTAPVASNSTDAGKAKNRRVEIVEQ